MVKKYTNYLKHVLIHILSFVINYLIFILFINFVGKNNVIGIQFVNLIAWFVSMLFIFFIDKLFVPDLVNENNSKELYKFILIRILGLIVEVLILFIFVSVLQIDHYIIKLISLVILFFLNHFYVSHVKFN